jgi:hypothetical protein
MLFHCSIGIHSPMASIILSFVGQQDPVSDATRAEGSIVSLIHHLVAQRQTIKQVVLLYTEGTKDRAELTQGWLAEEPFYIAKEAIALLPVDQALSHDPVDLLLAVQAARHGLERAGAHQTKGDTLELNGSSGTPVMKSAWSILQAAGYAPKSRVWQVRNPQEQKETQARVFQTNVDTLRQEFDLKVIQQQLRDYNYSGARVTLLASGLRTPVLEALMLYGHRRLSLDFGNARRAIAPFLQEIDPQWNQEIQMLERQDPVALLHEAYFSAVVELKNQQLSDFLVRISQFQEQSLQYFVGQQLEIPLPSLFDETTIFWDQLPHHHPDLYHFLRAYRFRDRPLSLEKFLNRPIYLAILEYGQHPALGALQRLNGYCEQRNRYVHQFEGISELDGVEDILRTIREVLRSVGGNVQVNPFNQLNEAIAQYLQGALGA